MIELRNRILKALLFFSLFGVLSFLWTEPISFTTADIGRHIKNGEYILQGKTDVLYKNFYSFTNPDYHFINHHWLFGVYSYLLWKIAGFNGLSIVYSLMMLCAFWLFYRVSRHYANFPLVFLLSMLTLLVISHRKEIRPEGFSTLCLGLYFYLLYHFKWERLSARWLWIVLIPIQILWVNTHIFFFMGPFLTAVFLWDAYLSNASQSHKNVLYTFLIATTVINLCNPSGLWGMLTPLNIFKEFGYSLAENQNVFFMMKRFPQAPEYLWYFLIIGIGVIGAVLAVKREGLKAHLPYIVLMIFVAGAGLKANRLIPFFAFFFVPIASRFYAPLVKQNFVKAICIVLGIFVCVVQIKQAHNVFGIGLARGVNASAEFYKSNGLKGPVFSNYDIGGYLIYHLADQEKLFVDNRQEAFPPDFFKKVYVPTQQDSEVWQHMQAKYHFNVIYFYRHDLTPWGQKFLVDRVSDPQWAAVFVDDYTIIFVKRNNTNQGIIDRFLLPQSIFRVSYQG